MVENKLIKKQLAKNTMFNIIAFTIIFTIFSFTIFTTLKLYLYQSTNKELIKEKARYENMSKSTRLNRDNIMLENRGIQKLGGMNLRLIHIERDSKGSIVNADFIGKFYDEYNIEFNANQLDVIYNISIGNYDYRALNFVITSMSGENRYIQLLVNVDSENMILENFLQILSIGTIIVIILSIIASYVLSKKSMEPVMQSMQKQMEFVQNASHELRTPLTIIQAKQELLLQEPNSKIIDKAEEIKLTLDETKRLDKLTKDLMVLARSDSNNMNINREKVDIDNMIKEIAIPYIEVAKLQKKEMNLEINFKEDIWIDRNKIHQVIVILLDNALKYTEEGEKIEINTEAREGKCVIKIKDTGIGISKEAMEHVFERFYREDKARARETGGSGLGLAIADCIITAHKGSIEVNENQPKGVIFTIKLPR